MLVRSGCVAVGSQAVRRSTVCESHKIPCFITALPLISCAIKVVVRTILSSSSSSITTTTTTSVTSQPSGDNWYIIISMISQICASLAWHKCSFRHAFI